MGWRRCCSWWWCSGQRAVVVDSQTAAAGLIPQQCSLLLAAGYASPTATVIAICDCYCIICVFWARSEQVFFFSLRFFLFLFILCIGVGVCNCQSLLWVGGGVCRCPVVRAGPGLAWLASVRGAEGGLDRADQIIAVVGLSSKTIEIALCKYSPG